MSEVCRVAQEIGDLILESYAFGVTYRVSGLSAHCVNTSDFRF